MIATGQIEFKQGEIDLAGNPVTMTPLGIIKEITLKMDEDIDFRNQIYMYGWKASFKFMYNTTIKYKLKTPQDRYTWAMNIVSMAGLGDFKTLEFFPGNFTHFNVIHNPLTKILYPRKFPIDHFLRGINAGGGAVVHDKIVNCIELNCAAVNGGDKCEFLTGTSEHILKGERKDITQKQFGDIDKIIKLEQEFLDENKIKKIAPV